MANKRIRSRRPRAKEDLLDDDHQTAPPVTKQRRLARQSSDLNREIHRLECLIADAPRLQKQRQMRRRNTLPPPEEFRFHSQREALAAPLPLHARQLQQKRRVLLLAQLTLVLLATAAIAGWTKQWLAW